MRIRTIKPEFWSHPVMARQTDAAKLLAIGLLNFADDEGYFFAEPAMVRAALRPLDEDSTIVRASLRELAEIGYLELREASSHGPLGKIVSFSTHQRVDRPTESKIRVIWLADDSANVRRAFDDQSSLEGKGRERKGTIKRAKKNGAVVSDEDFIQGIKDSPLFAGVDVDKELRDMDVWLLTHPSRKKTRRFITGWLGRADRVVAVTPTHRPAVAYDADPNSL